MLNTHNCYDGLFGKDHIEGLKRNWHARQLVDEEGRYKNREDRQVMGITARNTDSKKERKDIRRNVFKSHQLETFNGTNAYWYLTPFSRVKSDHFYLFKCLPQDNVFFSLIVCY